MELTRREFFAKAVQGAAVIATPALLSSLIDSCNSNPTGPGSSAVLPVIQGTTSNGIVTVTIDSSSPLSKIGGAIMISASNGMYLADHPDASTYNVLTSVCTHQGCTVNGYDSSSDQFVCPCHGSRYNVNGQVVQGPAPAPLQKLVSHFSNNQLSFTP